MLTTRKVQPTVACDRMAFKSRRAGQFAQAGGATTFFSGLPCFKITVLQIFYGTWYVQVVGGDGVNHLWASRALLVRCSRLLLQLPRRHLHHGPFWFRGCNQHTAARHTPQTSAAAISPCTPFDQLDHESVESSTGTLPNGVTQRGSHGTHLPGCRTRRTAAAGGWPPQQTGHHVP